mgnify:CR=1 FL=1
MKVGDVVKYRCSGQIGLVIEKNRRVLSDGNPNGDFMVYYRYKVLFDSETIMIQNPGDVEIINESR